MLDFNEVYNRTEAGMVEVRARMLGLRAELRRLLIQVNGSTSVSQLAAFVRGSEIATLIFELEAQGLIASPTSAIYRKTEAGVSEVQNRALGLGSDQRLLLILIDGQTALSRLASFFPSRTILDLVSELEDSDLIVAPNATGATIATAIAPAAIPDQATLPGIPQAASGLSTEVAAEQSAVDQRWLLVRSGAVRGLQRILGVTTHEWLHKLHEPTDSQELRAVIVEIQQTLEEQFGVETGQQFLDSVRQAADSSRSVSN